ncbi:hypothetical protein TNIN_367501 [Trichonephila inaurata madagascariensis]|uniref:Uncharacterized protein n=1 Tax=Trichonephila inaurata madagascariensis TaxID=2747483 RepID=A0A8X7CQL1_9ARAC|nr:hypothetical protein TNIN_367501 [Trichonephila inaurata madagascariensis]
MTPLPFPFLHNSSSILAIITTQKKKTKRKELLGATNPPELVHNDFLLALLGRDLAIIPVRPSIVHPSAFLEQMSAANDPEEGPFLSSFA